MIDTKLKEKLEKTGFSYIDNLEDIKKIIDFKEIHHYDVENQKELDSIARIDPIVIKDGLSIIICDNKNYNETYVIDIIEKFLDEEKEDNEEKQLLKSLNKFYVDSIELKWFIYKMGRFSNENIFKNTNIESEILVPSIFVMNKEKNDIGVIKESKISILDESSLLDALKYISKPCNTNC